MLAEVTRIAGTELPISALRSCVQIGGVSLGLSGDSCSATFLNHDLTQFGCETSNADIEVSAGLVPKLRCASNTLAFDSGALWKLFRDGKSLVFDFTSPLLGRDPYKRMWVTDDFKRAHIDMNSALLDPYTAVSPLEYPTDELLITNYLASGLGVEVHGCGLIDSETGGHLFLGHSGAGKSTTTRIWQSLRDPKILSDDRIILRLHNGELWMYGTPWHGEAAFASAAEARLGRIFILEHGDTNQLTPLAKAQAVGELFARSFPPFHSAAALNRTVEFLNRVVDAVPCFRFEFVPNGSAVEAILRFRGLP